MRSSLNPQVVFDVESSKNSNGIRAEMWNSLRGMNPTLGTGLLKLEARKLLVIYPSKIKYYDL